MPLRDGRWDPQALDEEVDVRQSMWKAVVTDSHFWIPVVVLVIGMSVLAAVR